MGALLDVEYSSVGKSQWEGLGLVSKQMYRNDEGENWRFATHG